MKRYIAMIVCVLAALTEISAQKPFKCLLVDNENGIKIQLDLYEETVNVPGMEIFGPMNGYLGGNVFGIWMVTSFKVESDQVAQLRFSNDLGSETQQARLVKKDDNTYTLELQDGVVIKKVVNKKLVKIPKDLTFAVQR